MPINFVRADLSTLQLPVFNGKDPTCFKSFLKAFKSAIANNNASDSDKYLLLERITQDEALSIVQANENDDETAALTDAIDALTRHYTDPYKYADEICGKIRTYPPINDENDGKAMATLSRFLKRQLNKSENNVTATKELNGSQIMTIVADKLPDTTRRRLTERMRKMIRADEQVGLQHVLEFLTDESERLDSSGIEVIFGRPKCAKTNVPRPAAKVMTVAASACPQCCPPPVNTSWPPSARPQVSTPNPLPPMNHPPPAPPVRRTTCTQTNPEVRLLHVL